MNLRKCPIEHNENAYCSRFESNIPYEPEEPTDKMLENWREAEDYEDEN